MTTLFCSVFLSIKVCMILPSAVTVDKGPPLFNSLMSRFLFIFQFSAVLIFAFMSN